MSIKTKHSALGARKNCPNFYPCPLCYGCRNYDNSSLDCQECARDNRKANVCKKNKHTSEILQIMINNQKIGGNF